MHEFSLMEGVFAAVCAKAQSAGAGRVLVVRLRIGALTGVVNEALEFAFEALRDGTVAQDARLKIEAVPAACWCARCDREFEPPQFTYACPACGEVSRELRRGREVEVVDMEVE